MDETKIKENFAQIQADLESKYAERNLLIDEMEKLRFMEFAVTGMPDGMEDEMVIPPTGYSIVENVVGTMVANDPQIRIPPAAMTARAQVSSSQLEKWTYGALMQLRMQQNEDVFERFMECMVAYGHACTRMLYAPQLWKGFPKKDKGEEDEQYNDRSEAWKQGRPLPIAWTWLDPRCAYPVWSDLGLEAVLEVDRRDPLAISRFKFNQISEPELGELERTHTDDSGEIEFAQLWTRKSLTYAIGGQVIHQEIHKYPNVPYVYAMGQAVASKDPARMGLSVLYPLRKIIPYLARLLSQKASAIHVYAWPTVILRQAQFSSPIGENVEGSDGAAMRSLDFTPGKPYALLPGEDISFLVWNGEGPDIDRQIGIIMEMCDRAGIPGTSMGANSGDSGYAVNQLIGAARMKLKPLIRHGEDALRQDIQNLWDIVEYRVKQKVPVYLREKKQGGWMEIGPDDLKGYRHVEVNLNPLLPTDTYAKSSQAINEYNATLRSRRSAREMVGIEQPEDEENQRLIELFLDRPEIQDLMSQAIVRKAGFMLEQQQQLPAGELVQRGMALPGAYQQAITDNLQGQPTQPPQAMAQGQPPVDPQVVLQAYQQGQIDINMIAQMVAQGALDLNAIGQIDPNLASQIAQLLQQMQQGGQGGAMPGGGTPPQQPPLGGGQPMGGGPMGANFPSQAGPNQPGGPPAAVYGGPNVQSAPGTPQPNSAAGAHVGRVVRPQGIAPAGGRAPGPRKQ
jgi:hypothetical protein